MADGPNKLYVGGIPKEMTEEQVKTLLLRYGNLRSYFLVKESNTNINRGFAFCEYANDEGTTNALTYLHGLKVQGSRTVTVRRQCPGMQSISD